MGKVKHRNKLIDRIKEIDDQNVIDEIHRLLNIEFDDNIYELNADQKREVEQARSEIQSGKGISSEKLNKEIDGWLGK